MAIIFVEKTKEVKSLEDVPHGGLGGGLEAFNEYVYSELFFPVTNPAGLHRAINILFGDGTAVIPGRFFNNVENDHLIPVKIGRCRNELVETKGGVMRHTVTTLIMPDGTVHVAIINTKYLFKEMEVVLVNPAVAELDPHSPNLTQEQMSLILSECLVNPHYYFRKVVCVPMPESETFEDADVDDNA